MPRQAGKTTLLRAITVDRALASRDRLIFTTAQTGKDAGERWKDLVAKVEASPLGRRCKVYRGAGAMSLHLPNKSQIRAFAPTPKSIHGYTPHMVAIDEVWAFDEISGADLMAAVRPSMITVPDKQLWLISTQGTAASALLNEMVDAGRKATTDPGAKIAYFEWSLPPEADTYDQQAWTFHPALGHTITLQDLAGEAAANSRGNFERSFNNRRTAAIETVIPIETWDGLKASDPALATDVNPARLTVGYEVARDRSAASVWVGWKDEAGKVQVRGVESQLGVHWLVPLLVRLHEEVQPGKIVADDFVHNRPVTKELALAGVPVTVMTAREYGDAFAALMTAVEDETIEHDGSANARTALEAASTRPLGGDGALAWSREKSTKPIDAISALTITLYYATAPVYGIQIF